MFPVKAKGKSDQKKWNGKEKEESSHDMVKQCSKITGSELVHITGGELVHITGGELVHITGGELVHITGGELVHITGGELTRITWIMVILCLHVWICMHKNLHGRRTVRRSHTCRRSAWGWGCLARPLGSAHARLWLDRSRRWPMWQPWR